MRLFYNPFKKKRRGPSPLFKRVTNLSNFTWSNKQAINKLTDRVNNMEIAIEECNAMCKPKKRGRPRKNV